jgi:L-fucose isomerase-like protein
MTLAADQHERALILGDLPVDYLTDWEITQDLTLAEAKLGIELKQVAFARFRTLYEELGPEVRAEASAIAERLWRKAEPEPDRRVECAPGLQDVEIAARQALALQTLVESEGAVGITLNCGPFVQHEDMRLPCASLGLLQDRGIVAACQIDVDVLLAMMLCKRVTDRPTFMGGPFDHGDRLVLNHCAIPQRMLGTDAPSELYTLGVHHGQGRSPTVRTSLPVGTTVTMARLTRDLERLVLATGTVVASTAEMEATDTCRDAPCCNSLVVEGAALDSLRPWVRGFQYHLAVAAGDFYADLSRLAEALGIPVASE